METRELETYLALNQRLGSCDWHHHDVCFSFPLLCMSLALAETKADMAIQCTGNVIFWLECHGYYICVSELMYTHIHTYMCEIQ